MQISHLTNRTMKKIILTITIMLFATTVQAQFNNTAVNTYVNNVFENVQGHLDKSGEHEGTPYVMGYASEYMDFSLVRTMISIITSTDDRVQLYKSWTKQDTGYQYSVVVDRTNLVVLNYREEDKLILIVHRGADNE
jgi:hypothetical protein